MSSVVLTKLTGLAGAVGVPPSLVLPALVAVGLVLLTWFYGRMARGGWYDMDAVSKIPGKTPLPIIGNAMDFTVPTHKFIDVSAFSFVFVQFLANG